MFKTNEIQKTTQILRVLNMFGMFFYNLNIFRNMLVYSEYVQERSHKFSMFGNMLENTQISLTCSKMYRTCLEHDFFDYVISKVFINV